LKPAVVPAIVVVSCMLSASCGGRVERAPAPPAEPVPADVPFAIIATDDGFEAPTSIPSGLRHVTFANHGSEIHEAMLVKLAQGMSAEDYVAAVKAGSLFPAGALDYSGPGLTSPGEATELWLTVDPGEYILICWNDSHASTRPVHRFTVLAEEVNSLPPPEDLTLKLLDYRFEVAGTLEKGTRVVRFVTEGPAMHEADLYLLNDGKTVDDLNRWRKEGTGPAPARALGGILDSHDIRRVVWLRRNFMPGRYVFHCEMPMQAAADAPSETIHADLGMYRELRVAE